MVHLRLNEREANPNKHINFMSPLPAPEIPSPYSEEDARQLLRALAAQVRPIMKSHGFAVNSLEEVRPSADCVIKILMFCSTSIIEYLLAEIGTTGKLSVSVSQMVGCDGCSDLFFRARPASCGWYLCPNTMAAEHILS